MSFFRDFVVGMLWTTFVLCLLFLVCDMLLNDDKQDIKNDNSPVVEEQKQFSFNVDFIDGDYSSFANTCFYVQFDNLEQFVDLSDTLVDIEVLLNDSYEFSLSSSVLNEDGWSEFAQGLYLYGQLPNGVYSARISILFGHHSSDGQLQYRKLYQYDKQLNFDSSNGNYFVINIEGKYE